MYYYSTIRLILIYRPSEDGRLSWPRHCSQCATSAQSCVSQWFSLKHKLLFAARFEPGPSRAAVKRVTTRPLRPAYVCICMCLSVAASSQSHSYLRSRRADTSHSAASMDTEDGTPAAPSGSATSTAESGSIPLFSRHRNSDDLTPFVEWLTRHVNLALTHGFDDNVGRNPVPSMFELASLSDWFAVVGQLHHLFWADIPADSRLHSHFVLLNSLSDADVRFSERFLECRVFIILFVLCKNQWRQRFWGKGGHSLQ